MKRYKCEICKEMKPRTKGRHTTICGKCIRLRKEGKHMSVKNFPYKGGFW